VVGGNHLQITMGVQYKYKFGLFIIILQCNKRNGVKNDYYLKRDISVGCSMGVCSHVQHKILSSLLHGYDEHNRVLDDCRSDYFLDALQRNSACWRSVVG
jgi:hypothetical protein